MVIATSADLLEAGVGLGATDTHTHTHDGGGGAKGLIWEHRSKLATLSALGWAHAALLGCACRVLQGAFVDSAPALSLRGAIT